MAENRQSIPIKFWTGGVNSLLPPSDIANNEFAWGENVMFRGGIVQTRPGFKLVSSVLGSRVQGFGIFTPRFSTARLVIAVDGLIYVAQWPSFNFVKIEGLKFNSGAPLINFCECIQSVKRHTDGSLEVIDPIKVLMIADGTTAVGMWDGSNARHLDQTAPAFETPIGLWMVWTSSRLWISYGTQIRVSDLGDPTSFSDDQFLATKSFFELPDLVTGVIETANERGLLVFTRYTTTAFQSQIRDRTTWGTTKDFQKLILPNIGCVGGRTACNQYGLTYWYSDAGLVALDAALNSLHSSKLQTVDGQMFRSSRNLSPDMSRACAVAYDNIALFSVPSGGRYNEQTWVLDQTPLENIGNGTGWAGVWTGIRPVQWVLGRVGGRKRLYCATFDKTPANNTRIHVWEAMRDDRKDDGGRIACQVQLPTISDVRTRIFKYVEFEVVELLGDVSLIVYVKPTRGPWVKLATMELRAEEGSIGSQGQLTLDASSVLQAFKPQSRTLRTPEWNTQNSKCSPEFRGRKPNHDKGFAVLFEWRGRMGISEVKMIYGDETQESPMGKCEPSEDGELNIVLETGEAL